MTNPTEDETRQTFCTDVRCNAQPHIQGDAGCFFANDEMDYRRNLRSVLADCSSFLADIDEATS